MVGMQADERALKGSNEVVVPGGQQRCIRSLVAGINTQIDQLNGECVPPGDGREGQRRKAL